MHEVCEALIGVGMRADPRPPRSWPNCAVWGVGRVVMLTGDSSATAAAVAGSLGIDEHQAHTLPDAKVDVVQALQAEGYVVAMVGDGSNDAPALALASDDRPGQVQAGKVRRMVALSRDRSVVGCVGAGVQRLADTCGASAARSAIRGHRPCTGQRRGGGHRVRL